MFCPVKGLSLFKLDRSMAEAEITGFVVLNIAQPPKTMDPTFPTMQLDGIFSSDVPYLVKGALCSFAEKIQTQIRNIYNINEVVIQMLGGRVRHI